MTGLQDDWDKWMTVSVCIRDQSITEALNVYSLQREREREREGVVTIAGSPPPKSLSAEYLKKWFSTLHFFFFLCVLIYSFNNAMYVCVCVCVCVCV